MDDTTAVVFMFSLPSVRSNIRASAAALRAARVTHPKCGLVEHVFPGAMHAIAHASENASGEAVVA